MNHIAKLMVLMILLFVITSGYVHWADAQKQYTLSQRSAYALASATKDATAVLRNDLSENAKNTNFDGHGREAKDYEIGRDAAMQVFMKSFKANLNPLPRTDTEIKLNLVRGIASYEGVMMYTSDDQWYPLRPYAFYDPDSQTTYVFTLGEALTTIRNGVKVETTLTAEPSPYSFITLKELRDHAVMHTISQAVNEMALKTYSARRSAYKMVFTLPGFDFTEKDGVKYYSDIGNVLTEPGMIAVYDLKPVSGRIPMRIANLSGSELGLQIE